MDIFPACFKAELSCRVSTTHTIGVLGLCGRVAQAARVLPMLGIKLAQYQTINLCCFHLRRSFQCSFSSCVREGGVTHDGLWLCFCGSARRGAEHPMAPAAASLLWLQERAPAAVSPSRGWEAAPSPLHALSTPSWDLKGGIPSPSKRRVFLCRDITSRCVLVAGLCMPQGFPLVPTRASLGSQGENLSSVST